MKLHVSRIDNRIIFAGTFELAHMHFALRDIHQVVQKAGYSDLQLDFSSCTAAYPAPMLALCAQVSKLRQANIDIDVIIPKSDKLRRLFMNANWAHFLAPRRYDPSAFRGYTQVPATQYSNSDDQAKAVNRIANAILGAIPDLERINFSALEWAINELTDNVLVHAKSPVGGFVQVSTFVRNAKRVAFIVADAGIGILTSLREGFPDLAHDVEALDKAIREGVTRDKSIGQGNGLFGSYQICSHSRGFFQVESGFGKLTFEEPAGLHIGPEPVPYEGTLVVAEIDFSNPALLEEALVFGGRRHTPVDYVDHNYQNEKNVVFKISEESNSYGSRVAGTPLRVKLLNLARMCPEHRIFIDFSNVALVSSSFADEVVGKLFKSLGPLTFMSRFQVAGATPTVQALIDRAIGQRMKDESES